MPPEDGGIPYRLGPSDELVIHVLPDPAIERKVVVQPDGAFAFDLIGAVTATGRTPEEVAKEIERRIREYRPNASASVVLERAASSSVAVLGEVANPGLYPVERSLRLTDILARAGDATTLAAAGRIRLIRRDGADATTYVANLDLILAGNVATDFLVLGGDVVYVPPARPVSIGHAVGRALYPLEVLARIFLAPFVGLATATD